MRLKEIVLFEGYQESLQSDLDNLIVSAKGSGMSQVNTQSLADQLSGMGYSVNAESIAALLGNNPMVTSATPQSVEISNQTQTQGNSSTDQEDSAARVSDLAQQASQKANKKLG